MGWDIFFICLDAVIALAGVALTLGVVYFFRYAVVRPKKEFSLDEMKAFWGGYADRVIAGMEYFRSLGGERLAITSYDGLKLSALYIPVENSVGTVVLMHGYHGKAEFDFSVIFEFYRNKGFNILAPDERAHGESEGKYITFGVRERYDCRDWTRLAATLAPDKPILLEGISMGAAIVMMASALELPEQVKALVADCGFTSPHDIFNCVIRSTFKLPAFPIVPLTGAAIKLFAGFGIDECSTLDAMKTNRLPVLFVHGEADNFVPPEMTMANYNACVAEKRLVTVPDASHAQSCLVNPEMCERALTEFIDEFVL